MFGPGGGTIQQFYIMPMYVLVRFGRWDEILDEPPPEEKLKYPRGIWHFARGLALLRSKRPAEAAKELGQLRELAADKSLDDVKIFEVNAGGPLLRLGVHVLAGELLAAEGNFAGAIEEFKQAVEMEDSFAYEEPQSWFTPTRHNFAAILLAAKRPADAEKVLREDLAKYPANGWSLRGVQKALEAQGKTTEAAAVAEQFARAWSRADVQLEGPCF
jgi:tetratricopeptide (TPR) repeat protein